jgi:hypothetical protein
MIERTKATFAYGSGSDVVERNEAFKVAMINQDKKSASHSKHEHDLYPPTNTVKQVNVSGISPIPVVVKN